MTPPPVDWLKVEDLKRRTFYGSGLVTPEEQALLFRALEEDRERYRKIETDLKEEYAKSLRMT